MEILERMPKELQNQVFTKLKNVAEIAQMSPDERLAYEISLLYQYDTENALYTKYVEGKEEGREEGIEIGLAEGVEKGLKKGREEGFALGEEKANLRTASNMLKEGFDPKQIIRLTGLTLEQIQSLPLS